jgi:transcriptional regulator with XRE-family HTH domain
MPAHAKDPDFAARSRDFSEKIRRRYDELGWTQQRLISETGLSRTYVQMLLNHRGSTKDPGTGQYKPFNPTLDVIWILAEVLDLDLDYLMDPSRDVGDD